MVVLFSILAILAFFYGANILLHAESAIHEIEALILFLISAVFLSGAGVINAVNALRKKMVTLSRQTKKD